MVSCNSQNAQNLNPCLARGTPQGAHDIVPIMPCHADRSVPTEGSQQMTTSPAWSPKPVPVVFEVVRVMLVPLTSAISRSVGVTTQIWLRRRCLRQSTCCYAHTSLAGIVTQSQGRVLLHNHHHAFVTLAFLGLFLSNALLAAKRLPLLQVLDLTSGKSDGQQGGSKNIDSTGK